MGKTLAQAISKEIADWKLIENVATGRCGMAFTTLRNIVEAAMEEGLIGEHECQSLLTDIGE